MKFTENGFAYKCLGGGVGQDTVVGLTVPPCLLPPPTLWILDWVSSSYVHANNVNEIQNTVLIFVRIGGFGKVDKIS